MDFQRADIESPVTACAACRTTLHDRYFVAGGAMVCEACARQIEKGVPEEGRVGRVLKALGLGTLFGLGGTIVYGIIFAATDYQLALLTILIGWLVGTGVRKGASGAGGLGYQIMGAVLTYILCVMAFVPALVVASMNGPDGIPMVFAILFAVPYSLVMPFTGDLSVIGLAILAFGMYQGFKIPAFIPLEVAGPYDLRVPVPAEKTPETFFEGGGEEILASEPPAPEDELGDEAAQPAVPSAT